MIPIVDLALLAAFVIGLRVVRLTVLHRPLVSLGVYQACLFTAVLAHFSANA